MCSTLKKTQKSICADSPTLTNCRKRNYRLIHPKIQEAIVARYEKGSRTNGAPGIAKDFGLPVTSVNSVLNRSNLHAGNPVQPRGHRKRILTSQEERQMFSLLDKHPQMTNTDLATKVKNKIAGRTVSDYLRPYFSTKRFFDQEPEEFSDDWKTEMKNFITKVRQRIPLATRIYADESAIFTNTARRTGRGRIGQKLKRYQSRYATKFTLHLFITRTHVLYWEICKKNADTAEVERVARKAARKVDGEKHLIWDRLGKSGRCRHPKAQHYSPIVKEVFKKAGVTVLLLPPKGKYLNPAELVFNDFKNNVLTRGKRHEKGQMTLRQLRTLTNKYFRNLTSDKLKRFFWKRANGREVEELKLLG